MQTDLTTMFAEPHPARWYRIDDEAKRRGIVSGIYRVHAGVAGDAESFQAIPRLLKPDLNGRLYIGRAGVFTDRFILLMKTLNPERLTANHGFGRSYASLAAVCNRFPLDCLRFTLRFSERYEQVEREELAAYREEFGELPPFNGSLPGDPDLT
jgi:hypothetical protein